MKLAFAKKHLLYHPFDTFGNKDPNDYDTWMQWLCQEQGPKLLVGDITKALSRHCPSFHALSFESLVAH